MNYEELKKQFPHIKKKSEKWYYNEITNKWISAEFLPKYLSFIVVRDIDKSKLKFKQVDSFKSKRR